MTDAPGTEEDAATTEAARPEEAPPEEAPPDEAPTAEDDARYKRRVAVVLALLAVLGAWISVLRTDAATNESRYARETTRTAEQALRARVNRAVVQGLGEDLDAEQTALALTSPFRADGQGLSGLGDAPADQADIGTAFGSRDRTDLTRRLTLESETLDLRRTSLAETRVTFNNRSSQYETVLTTLGVALFLVGFTLVLSRRTRPPILVPGLILVCYVIGWALWIHHRPIPTTAEDAIDAAARGATALQLGDPAAAVGHYDRAVDLDGDFGAAYSGRALAAYVAANPDFRSTLAVVDADSDAAAGALADAERALALGDGRDLRALVQSGAFRFFAGDYDGAVERLDQADALQESSPEAAVLRAAAELARGDDAAVQAALDEALARLDTTQASAQNRAVAADLFTLLEWVAVHEPDRADAAEAVRLRLAAGESALVVGHELGGEVPDGASVDVAALSVDGDQLSLTLDYEGLPDDTPVAAYLYEQPAEGAAFVQAPEMARFGELSGSGSISGSTTIARACTPVALRLDVYLDGALAGSFDAPGGAATC